MLFLDGVYVDGAEGGVAFHEVRAPIRAELTDLARCIARRVGRLLERQALLEQDAENTYLAGESVDEDAMAWLRGHSIIDRIGVGPQAGRKVLTLQTLPAGDPEDAVADAAGKIGGFSLHAGVAARADERGKLERLCRCISRSTVSGARLSLTAGGNLRYRFKTPYCDDTTHGVFEPPAHRVAIRHRRAAFMARTNEPASQAGLVATPTAVDTPFILPIPEPTAESAGERHEQGLVAAVPGRHAGRGRCRRLRHAHRSP